VKIKEMINTSLVELNLTAKSKDEVLLEMAKMLQKQNRVNNLDGFLAAVKERELHGSTGIGFGIAIPHGKSKFVNQPSLVFGRSTTGIEFEALDELPAHIFFMIAVPDGSSDLHLHTLAKLSRKLIDEDFRETLLKVKTVEEIIVALEKVDKGD
jgi:PTS system nitrogen regulatory IIA component